jgi:hypothetical protein
MFLSLTTLDILISGFYTLLFLGIANFLSNNFKKKYGLKKARFLRAFIIAKLLGSILFSILHVFIYKGGDTFVYFSCSLFYLEQFLKRPLDFFQLLSMNEESLANIIYGKNFIGKYYLSSGDVRLMGKIGSVFALLGFKQFMATNILISMFSCFGIWKIFSIMCTFINKYHTALAIGILFYPTTIIWSSGLLKDTISLTAIGLIFWSVNNFTYQRKVIKSILFTLASVYACIILKPYILYIFIPSMLLWAQDAFTKRIQNKIVKSLFRPLIIAVFAFGGFFFIDSISESAGKYSLENAVSVAEGFQSWHSYLAETRSQSGYSLGEVEFTPLGVLTKSPEAFFVTFYRPLIFVDVTNFATAFEAVQSLILLFFTIYVFVKVGLLKSLKLILSNHHVRAFFIFAVIFGVTVGITSYNFGALSRYKIPALPFFTTALIFILYYGNKDHTKTQNQKLALN